MIRTAGYSAQKTTFSRRRMNNGWDYHPHVPQQNPPVYSQQPGAVYPNLTYPASNPQVVYMQQPAAQTSSSSAGSSCCALCCGICCGAVCAECCGEILCCCCQTAFS